MKHVRFLRNWDFWPSNSVVMVNLAGEEKKITEAQYEAAHAAGAVELIDGDQEQGQPAPEAGGSAGQGKAGDKARTPARR